MSRPIRFTATLTATDPASFVEAARRAEDLGYSGVSIADHLDNQLAPMIALMAAADATTTLRIMTLVLANDYRHPAVLAKEVTSLDQLSGGRLDFGIGAGWMRADYDQAGMAYDRPGRRIDRLAESVAILKALFTGEPVVHHGDHYDIDGLVNTPPPLQSPHPPLLIAGGGPKILGLAAREADIVGLNPGLAAGVIDARAGATATPSATDRKLEWIREAAGSRFASIELQTRVHLAAVTDDREGLAAGVAPALGLDVAEALDSPHALVGTVEQCIETVLSWRERWGITCVGIGGDAMDAMAPVVARFA